MRLYLAILAFFATLLCFNLYGVLKNRQAAQSQPIDFEVTSQVAFQIEYGSTIFDTLRELDIPPVTIHEIVNASKKVFNLSRIPADTDGIAYFTKGPFKSLSQLEVTLSPVQKIYVVWSPEKGWITSIKSVPVTKKLKSYEGNVAISLWDSAQAAGVSPLIISKLADIFAWQIDFSREVQSGDKWKIVVEELMVDNVFYGYGKILVAEYDKEGHKFTAIRFPAEGDKADYYSPDGQSLRRLFLKSPLRFARISSRFTRKRFHPLLKTARAHNGVDYAAAPGTPIKTVGDGKVEFANWRGGCGRTVKIKHNSTYSTAYCHLKSFARGLRAGQRVQQGQVIGYVGSSGLATGPHLHFEFYQNDRYVDPLGHYFPSADPINAKQAPAFKKVVNMANALLLKTDRAVAAEQKKG